MLSNSSVGIPSDMWIPANGQLKPAVMKQVALGYERSLAKGMYTLSLETYYRKTNHIVDFVDNANIFLNNQIETQLTTGYSKAYGAEFYISKNSGAANRMELAIPFHVPGIILLLLEIKNIRLSMIVHIA